MNSSNILLSEKIHVVSWIILNNEQSKITISEEERAEIVQGIIHTLPILMKSVTAKSAKNCARDGLKSHKTSPTAIVRSTVFFNTLTNVQRFPARPIDTRINFPEEDRNIEDYELSYILASIVNQGFLENKKEKFPYPRGRPPEDTKKIRNSGRAKRLYLVL